MLVRCLWDKQRRWDDPQLPSDLLQQWKVWGEELQFLPRVLLPQPYLSKDAATPVKERELHIFCDTSEQAYWAVAYLRMVGSDGRTHLAFVMARSRVAPKRLTGAQISKLVGNELTLGIETTVLWTDSTTVLAWLGSESCHFKVCRHSRS